MIPGKMIKGMGGAMDLVMAPAGPAPGVTEAEVHAATEPSLIG